MRLRIALFVLAGGVVALVSPLSSAQVPETGLAACLHGPSEQPDQRSRRQQALRTAAQINQAEHRTGLRDLLIYRPFEQLGVAAPPEGFRLQLTFDKTGYAFSLKDTTDPCVYAIFSDQDAWIYAATPQPRPQVLRTETR